jgi:hypothetical protein
MTAMPSSAVRPPADRAERTAITAFCSWRAAQIAEDRRCREQRFNAELVRRLEQHDTSRRPAAIPGANRRQLLC